MERQEADRHSSFRPESQESRQRRKSYLQPGVTTGGFLGIGDTPLAVNWKDVKIGPDVAYVNTPLTVESVAKYGLFDGMPDQVAIGPREWRATELIGDYVNLKDIHYGQVRDLIISKDGELKAVATVDMGVITPIHIMVLAMAGILATTITICPRSRREILDCKVAVPKSAQRLVADLAKY